jgi:acyl carrier protein
LYLIPWEDLRLVFVRSLKLPPDTDVRDLRRFTSSEWDSLAHMSLVVEIEERFDVRLSMEDIEQIQDFGSTRQVLSRLGIAPDPAPHEERTSGKSQ